MKKDVIKIKPFTLESPVIIGDKIEIIYRHPEDGQMYKHKFKASSVALFEKNTVLILDTKSKIKYNREKGIHE